MSIFFLFSITQVYTYALTKCIESRAGVYGVLEIILMSISLSSSDAINFMLNNDLIARSICVKDEQCVN